MPRASNPRRSAAALALAVLLNGCVEKGDFGRVRTSSTWNHLVEETGALASAARREPVSGFPLTDDERDLRGRAWRFLVPANDRAYLETILAELVATRVLPPSMRIEAPSAYFDALLSADAASPASRYRRLSEDASADFRLLGPFADAASRVLAADRVRLATLDRADVVSVADAGNALARVAENRCLIAWVQAGLNGRIDSYRYALQHLVIAAPQGDAVPAERAVARLADSRGPVDALPVPPLAAAACLGESHRPAPRAAPVETGLLIRKG